MEERSIETRVRDLEDNLQKTRSTLYAHQAAKPKDDAPPEGKAGPELTYWRSRCLNSEKKACNDYVGLNARIASLANQLKESKMQRVNKDKENVGQRTKIHQLTESLAKSDAEGAQRAKQVSESLGEIGTLEQLMRALLDKYVMGEGETWPSDCLVDDAREACGMIDEDDMVEDGDHYDYPKRYLCTGCWDDHYNQELDGGCWHLPSARRVQRTQVHVTSLPPYVWFPVDTLSCHQVPMHAWIKEDDPRIAKKEYVSTRDGRTHREVTEEKQDAGSTPCCEQNVEPFEMRNCRCEYKPPEETKPARPLAKPDTSKSTAEVDDDWDDF